MTQLEIARRLSAAVSDSQWHCDLAKGLLKPQNADVVQPLRIFSPQAFKPFQECGLPALKSVPISEQLAAGHPFERFIRKSKPLNISDLHQILGHPMLDLSLIGFKTGAISAAVQNHLLDYEGSGHAEDYSRNMWARDSIITAAALNRAGFSDKAEQIVKNLWNFAGSEHHRGKILQFHWGPMEERRRRFIEGNDGPHIKFSIGAGGEIGFCNHDWGHQQLDALGAMVWAPYRFANNAAKNGEQSEGGHFDLRLLDPDRSATDSILPAALKMFYGAGVHDTLDYGPWEDIREWRRATSVGIVVAALREASEFHEREGWGVLPVEYNGRQDPRTFRSQVQETLGRCLETVHNRIPTEGLAAECDRRPVDSAMMLLLYPFDCGLSVERQNTILRTVYRNMGEVGFRRWERDAFEGPDRYVGQDYHHNRNPEDKGEFAARSNAMRPAEWSLFDPLLAAYFYRRFVESGAREIESYVYADRHLKRSLSFITPGVSVLNVAGKGRSFTIPRGILPEAFAWDSRRESWLANHNSPLLMAQAALGLAFERAQDAILLVDAYLREARILEEVVRPSSRGSA